MTEHLPTTPEYDRQPVYHVGDIVVSSRHYSGEPIVINKIESNGYATIFLYDPSPPSKTAGLPGTLQIKDIDHRIGSIYD